MVGLPGILALGTLFSKLKCADVLYKLVVCTFVNSLRMHAFLCHCHTVCSPAYCLRTEHDKQECRFHYPKALCEETVVYVEDGDVELQTARNDPLINNFNCIKLSGWHANVDMQYCVSRQKVISLFAKYVTKCEPCSQSLKDVLCVCYDCKGVERG